jgi:hypothetical protein
MRFAHLTSSSCRGLGGLWPPKLISAPLAFSADGVPDHDAGLVSGGEAAEHSVQCSAKKNFFSSAEDMWTCGHVDMWT